MQLSSGKKNAPAPVEEERRPQAEARPGGEMPAMPGAAHAADAATPFAAMLDERTARATDLAAWKEEKSPAAEPAPTAWAPQPGGSVRDDLVIQACDKYGMVMAFTGVRLFHH